MKNKRRYTHTPFNLLNGSVLLILNKPFVLAATLLATKKKEINSLKKRRKCVCVCVCVCVGGGIIIRTTCILV